MFSTDGEPTHKSRLGPYAELHKLPHIPHYGTYKPIAPADDTDVSTPPNGEIKGPVGTSSRSTKKKLGLAALVVLIYYEVSGGPFGIEDIVRAGGPLFAILGFSLFIVWVIPEALVTAELSTALPEASGAVAWVDTAFGPFWAFQKGWLSWLSGVTDNALYPILFLDCLVDLLTADTGETSIFAADGGNFLARWSFIVAVIALLTYLNYRGLDIVGKVAMVICLLSLMPFVAFCAIGATKVQPARWLRTPPGGAKGVNWSLLLNTFFWNINYWESAACFSGEVKEPSRDYPIGMFLAILLVFITLLVPILVATGASDAPYDQWTDGYFVQLGREIGGPWLAYWLMFASALSNIGMFEAEMSSDSWQVAGMADRGILPAVLGARSEYDTPVYGILLSAGGVLCLGWMSFGEVVAMLNLLYCYSQLIEFAAFLHLRVAHPELPRPFRIPIGTVGMCILLALPMAFIGVVVYFSSPLALGLSALLCAMGGGAYYLLQLAKERGWCEFEERHIHDHDDVLPQ